MLWQSFFITRLLDTYNNVTYCLIFSAVSKLIPCFSYLFLFLVNIVIVRLLSC